MFTALEYGRSNGLRVPDEIHILGIGVEDVTTFSEECTPRVAAACAPATIQVLERIVEIGARRAG
jgi:hypothetical protein